MKTVVSGHRETGPREQITSVWGVNITEEGIEVEPSQRGRPAFGDLEKEETYANAWILG